MGKSMADSQPADGSRGESIVGLGCEKQNSIYEALTPEVYLDPSVVLRPGNSLYVEANADVPGVVALPGIETRT